MQPYIRKYNYIQNYYETVYNYYSPHYPGFPVTYYSLDLKNSVYDKNLVAGSYEKIGVGDLSGIKWKKILFLPVTNVEQITPTNNAGEKGLTMHDSEFSSVTFASTYGLTPSEWDVVHFSQDFMSPDNNEDGPVFTVINTNPATIGNMTHWQCRLKVAPFRLSAIKKQISYEYMFLEFTKSIMRLDIATLLLRLQTQSSSMADQLRELFNDPAGFYFQEV